MDFNFVLRAGLKVSLTKFILVIKLFILEVPLNKAYKELWLAYNTTHKMNNRIRQRIFKFGSGDDEFLSGEVEMDESYFGGRRKVKRRLLFFPLGCLATLGRTKGGRGCFAIAWQDGVRTFFETALMKCCSMCLVE